jgi:hypothetical protein
MTTYGHISSDTLRTFQRSTASCVALAPDRQQMEGKQKAYERPAHATRHGADSFVREAIVKASITD